MSEVEDYRRQADECFRRYNAGDHFSKAFWLGLSKQWARMVDENNRAAASITSTVQLGKLRDVLDEALSEKLLHEPCKSNRECGGSISARASLSTGARGPKSLSVAGRISPSFLARRTGHGDPADSFHRILVRRLARRLGKRALRPEPGSPWDVQG
jgi:hypothetical protein